ncbi:hypothetical protein CR513_42219, partial [Mucuna pruriens]
MVNKIGALTELTSLVSQLAVGQHQPSIAARVYSICTSVKPPTDMCLTLQEIESDHPDTGSSHIRVGHLIIRNLESNHFGQGRVKGHMQLNNADLPQMHLKDQQVIDNRLCNIRHHHSSNNNNNRECQLKDLMKQLAASNLEFQQTMSSNNMQF